MSVLALVFFSIPEERIDYRVKPHYDAIKGIILSECPDMYLPNRIIIEVTDTVYPKALDPLDTTIGTCVFMGGQFKILLKKSYYVNSLEEEQYNLVAHELGHCILGQLHNDIPSHFMYPTVGYLNKDLVNEQLREVSRKRCNK